MSRAALAWRGYAIVALALALVGIGHWVWAITLRAPVLYGEGAVAHAALLARDRLEYTTGASTGAADALRPLFTAANYPPLYFWAAGIGDDPFVVGRVMSVLAVLFVTGAIAWRARPAGWLVAGAIALAWLGSVPVLQWGAAVKPDLLALGLTVGAVVALDRGRPRAFLAGVLIGLAVMTKPTAVLPGLALLAFVLSRDRSAALRGVAGGMVGVVLVSALTLRPDKEVWTHVVDWNALPWRAELAAPLVLVALLVLAVPIVTLVVTRPSTTVVTAYVAGAVGVLLLGGREGATINYFLDLSAALALAIAGRAPRLGAGMLYPVASIVQAAVAIVLVNPFGVVPSRPPGPGAWADPGRVSAVAALPGTLLVEDGGLLLATGREPLVDDLFLWSRNRAVHPDGRFAEGDLVLDAVRAGRFDAVVSEVDLARVAEIGGYEAQRWHPDLVRAVLERYPQVQCSYGQGYGNGLCIYRKG